MLFGILGEDEDVLDLQPHEHSQVISNNIVDNTLELRWFMAEAKRHDDPFEGSKLCIEGVLLDIFVMDSNLMKSTDQVNLQQDRGAPKRAQY